MTKYIKVDGKVYSQKRHRHSKWGTYDPSSKDKKKVIPLIVDQFMDKPFIDAILIEMNILFNSIKMDKKKISRVNI